MPLNDFDKTEELDLREIRKELRKVTKRNDPKRTGFTLGAQFGIIAALFVTLALTAQAFYILTVGPSISLIDSYATPAFKGRNGEGTIIEFHPEKDAVEKLQEAREALAERNKDHNSLDIFLSSLNCSFDHTENLSNGDTVVYACKYNKDAASATGYRIIDTSYTYTVHGLSEADPFLHLEPSWSLESAQPVLNGTDPDYHYTYKYDSPYITVYAENTLSFYSKQYEIGNPPVLINDPKKISSKDREQINSLMKERIEKEMTKCTEEISVNHSQPTSSTPSLYKITTHNDHLLLTYTVRNIYSADKVDTHYHFTITFEASVYRTDDGTIIIESNTADGCKYDGIDRYYAHEAK